MQQLLGSRTFEHLCLDQLKDVLGQVDIGGKQENRHLGANALEGCGDFSAIGVGHEKVEDNPVEAHSLEEFDAGLGGLSCKDFVIGAFENGFADLEANFFVVDAEQS